MSDFLDRQKVYDFVFEHASEHLETIIQAVTDGVREENLKLRKQKSKVECGLVVLADSAKLNKLEVNMKSVLIEGLQNCTFIKPDSMIEKLRGA